MQCDKVVDFSEGTDAKSANLPQIFQNLHSHTASVATVTDPYLHNTNFFACNSNPTESTPSEAEPSAECRENTESQVDSESSVGIDSMFDTSDSDSDSKTIAQSTTPKNPSEALPNVNSACDSTRPKQNLKILNL